MNDEAEAVRRRSIRSYVLRQGRLTAGQQRALENLGPKYLLAYAPKVLDWRQVFARSAEVVVEIGFGMGSSLITQAKAEPERDFLGVEVHQPGVGACLLQIEAQGVHNLRLIRADALLVLEQMIAPESLARLQLFFPDPWPKSRHHKRRIVQAAFVDRVHSRLGPGGIVHMATDWQPYAKYMLEVMLRHPGFVNLAGAEAFAPRPEYRPMTKFEQRGQRLGHGVWDLLFQRL